MRPPMRPAHRITTSSLVLALVLAMAGFVAPSAVAATDSAGSGHIHLTSNAAAAFVVPSDVSAVSTWTDQVHGLEYTRYQQFARPFGVHVEGAQLTVVKREGRQVLVIGSYYAGLRVLSLAAITAFAAKTVAAAGIHVALDQRSELRFDQTTGRLFYRVESAAEGVALVHEIDAATGKVLASWDATKKVDPYDGVGVKGDTKSLAAGSVPGIGNLTSQPNGPALAWRMTTVDGHFSTYTAGGGKNYVGQPLVPDDDNVWNAANQRAAVDAQYYAALTAAFYLGRLSFDVFAACGQPGGVFEHGLRSVVHYDPTPSNGVGYANAQWDPFAHYMIYGDGNGQTRAMSGAQDVVTHELTHAVTQCRADLDYFGQSGALNEAFSDIMAVSAEWDFEEPLSSNCRRETGQTECADWLLGEDTSVDPTLLAFRDFEDPITRSDPSQPSHFDDAVYLKGPPSRWNDSGGVHYNSGIANHAFYLLVNGGRNGRCAGPTDPQDDCDVTVPGIGLTHAEQIFFAGFGMLTTNATFCDARKTTLAAADTLFPGSVADHVGVDLAWAAVGRTFADCPPLPSDFSISVASPVAAAAPGGNGALTVNLTRGTQQNGQIDFDVVSAGPISTASFDPDPSLTPDNTTELTLGVPANAADGVYPVLISANDGSTTRYSSAALVVDSVNPTVDIGRARFVSSSTVGLDGKIKQRIDWSASDDGSGVTTAELDHSPNGQLGSWSAIFGPAAPTDQTDYDAAAGAHQYRVIGTDAVGNSSTSLALTTTLSSAQENAVSYTKTWSKFGTGTTWGTTRFAKRRGASATYTFSGTDVVWIAQRGPKRGNAYVYLDGVRRSVSLYAPSLSERRVVFVGTNLAPGQHTLKIVCRGTSNRPRVDVDGFFVLNQ